MSPLNQPGSGNIFGSLANNELLGKITEFFGETDPRLNKIKESVMADLESLKKSPRLDALAANMWKSAEEGLKKDLKELGVDDARTPKLVAAARAEWDKAIHPAEMAEILKSPEKGALDAYIANVENLPVLKDIISSAQPRKNWEIWLDGIKKKIPGLGAIAGPLLSLFGFKKDDEQTKKILGLLEDKKTAKPGEQAQTAQAETPAQPAAPEAEKAKVELTEEEKAVLKPLQDAGILMDPDPNSTKEDMEFLTKQGLDTNDKKIELTTNAVSATGNTKKIFEAIKTRMGEEKAKLIGFRLVDIWQFEKELTPENITKVIAAIPNVPAEQKAMRKFLNAARLLKTKPDAIENMAQFA